MLSNSADEEVIPGLFQFSEIVSIAEILVAHLVRSYLYFVYFILF